MIAVEKTEYVIYGTRGRVTMADEQTVDSKSPQEIRFTWVPEMWANVSGKGAANQFHFHPGSFWSAVAYVDDGYNGSTDPKDGGAASSTAGPTHADDPDDRARPASERCVRQRATERCLGPPTYGPHRNVPQLVTTCGDGHSTAKARGSRLQSI